MKGYFSAFQFQILKVSDQEKLARVGQPHSTFSNVFGAHTAMLLVTWLLFGQCGGDKQDAEKRYLSLPKTHFVCDRIEKRGVQIESEHL